MKHAILVFSLAAVATLGGCISARATVGPNFSSGGDQGVSGTGGAGLGWTLHGKQAMYVDGNLGGVYLGHARAQMYDSLTYVNYDLATPIRIDARLGWWLGRKKFDEAARPMLGFGFAWLPWADKDEHRARSSDEDDGYGFDPLANMSVLDSLGVEVAVDALPAITTEGSHQDGLVVVTLGLTGDFSMMRRH